MSQLRQFLQTPRHAVSRHPLCSLPGISVRVPALAGTPSPLQLRLPSRMEVIRWLDSHSRISNKLIALVQADLREVDTVKAVFQRYHLDRQTVKAVDKLQLITASAK